MQTIDITPNWHEMCRIIEMLLVNGTHEGRQSARQELRKMASLADAFGKELEITVFAMTEAEPDSLQIAENGDVVTSYDIMLRVEGEDPLQEWEDIKDYNEVLQILTTLGERYPVATVNEVGG